MSKWFKISILIAGVVLIGIGLFQIFGGKQGASDAIVDKFNKLEAPFTDIKNDFASEENLLGGIGAKELKKDYAGINSDLQTAIIKLDDAAAKITSTSYTLDELQKMINKSSTQNIKTTGSRFIEAHKARNAATMKTIIDTKNLINLSITYYSELSQNKRPTITEKQLGDAANLVSADAQDMVKAGGQHDSAANEFAKAVGFTVEKK